MKKGLSIALGVLLILSVMAACQREGIPNSELATSASSETKTEPKVLRLISFSPVGAIALNTIAKNYHEKYPNNTIETTVMPSVESFNTTMSAKFAAGDVPDLILYQSGSNTSLYAAGGHLMDLTDTKFLDRAKPDTDIFSRYEGKIYAIPVDLTINGVFYNKEVAKKYKVDTTPKNLQQFLDVCQEFVNKGLKEPIVMAAKDGSAITAFNFQYIYQHMYRENPKFYVEVLQGQKHWNDAEFKSLFDTYEKFKKYINKDALGMDTAGAYQKFSSNNAAFLIGGTFDIGNIRKGNPDLDMELIASPWLENEEDLTAVSDVNSIIAISNKTKYPEEAKEFLDIFTSVDSGNIYSKEAKSISAIKGTEVQFDKSLYNQLLLLDAGKRVGFFSRQWIPGIKDIMKTATQEWFAGKSADEVLNRLESEHQRLIKANPRYVQKFIEENK